MDNGQNTYKDKALLEMIARGNEEAFSLFFERHKQTVFEVAFKMTRSIDMAQELSQDFFLKMWNKRQALTEVINPGAYLYMSIYYLSIDFLRRKGRDENRVEELRRMAGGIVHNNDTQEKLDERQLRSYIDQAAARLPDLKKKVFEMRYKYQESYDDIAQALNISKGTAQVYFHNAVSFIRTYIDERTLPGAGILVAVLLLEPLM